MFIFGLSSKKKTFTDLIISPICKYLPVNMIVPRRIRQKATATKKLVISWVRYFINYFSLFFLKRKPATPNKTILVELAKTTLDKSVPVCLTGEPD